MPCVHVLFIALVFKEAHHSAAEGPEPPEESQDEEQHQDEQSYSQDGPIRLEQRQSRLTA